MAIPVEVPGLNTILPEIGDGRVILVEGGADAAKSFFLRRLSLTALRSGSRVAYLTSRDRAELVDLLAAEGVLPPWLEGHLEIVEADTLDGLVSRAELGGVLAVDSFSYLALDVAPAKLASMLRELRVACRQHRTVALLATEAGMLDERSESVAVHLADGFVQFHAKEGPEGIVRYLRVPKWTDGQFVDRNIYYAFDGKRIAIDLRSRVL